MDASFASFATLLDAAEILLSESQTQSSVWTSLPSPINRDKCEAHAAAAASAAAKSIDLAKWSPLRVVDHDGNPVDWFVPRAPRFTFNDYHVVQKAEFPLFTVFASDGIHEALSNWWTPGRIAAYAHVAGDRIGDLVREVESAAHAAGVRAQCLPWYYEVLNEHFDLSDAAAAIPVDQARIDRVLQLSSYRRCERLRAILWSLVNELAPQTDDGKPPESDFLTTAELALLVGVQKSSLLKRMSECRQAWNLPLGEGNGRQERRFSYSAVRAWLLAQWPDRWFPESFDDVKVSLARVSDAGRHST